MHQCAEQTAAGLDSMLDALESRIQGRLPPGSPESSAIWRDYRRQHCDFEAAFFPGGSVQPAVYLSCYGLLTSSRIRRLAVLLCEGHGLTGDCAESREYTDRLSRLDAADR
jgi:hypothetical protein